MLKHGEQLAPTVDAGAKAAFDRHATTISLYEEKYHSLFKDTSHRVIKPGADLQQSATRDMHGR